MPPEPREHPHSLPTCCIPKRRKAPPPTFPSLRSFACSLSYDGLAPNSFRSRFILESYMSRRAVEPAPSAEPTRCRTDPVPNRPGAAKSRLFRCPQRLQASDIMSPSHGKTGRSLRKSARNEKPGQDKFWPAGFFDEPVTPLRRPDRRRPARGGRVLAGTRTRRPRCARPAHRPYGRCSGPTSHDRET